MNENVELLAEAIWNAFRVYRSQDDWPTWGELVAQGHQGMHRVNEYRLYARAALNWMALQ